MKIKEPMKHVLLFILVLFALAPYVRSPVFAQNKQKASEEARLITNEKYMPNYPGSPKSVRVEKKNETYFKIRFPDGGRSKVGFFLFRAEGLTPGKTYRFDLTNVPDKWRTLNPVFSEPDVKNLKDPKFFESKPVRQPEQLYKSPNGARIPNTSGQKWHYMHNVEWNGSRNTLVCKQRFKGEQSWISMRVPMTLEYREAVYEKIQKQNKPFVKIHKVGESKGGNPLKIVEIGGLTDKARKTRPTVVWWQQEHADEHDTSWMGDGVIRFFLRNSPLSRQLRKKANFLVVMLADPDGTIRSQYKNKLHTFIEGSSSKMSRAYGRWFRKWLNQNWTITCVNTIHNVENHEMKVHLANASVETKDGRYTELMRLHNDIVKHVRNQGFKVNKKPWGQKYRNDRLGGFLRRHAQSAHLFYETNSQMPGRKLTLHNLRMLGVHISIAIVDHLYSKKANALLKSIRLKRKKREWLLDRYGILQKSWQKKRFIPHEMYKSATPLMIESLLWDMPGLERSLYLKNTVTTYKNEVLKKLYSQEGVSFENLKDMDSIRLSSSNK
jgi:hypothetical protein